MLEMKKKIYTHKFLKPVKVTGIDEDGVTFSDGTKITHEHKQDCCENVYAEWEALKEQTFNLNEYKQLEIWGNEKLGVIINSYSVPCYDYQNGYYNSVLELVIMEKGKDNIIIDITDFTQEEYC